MQTSQPTLVDYTKARLNSKSYRGRKIERCPECGQKGEHTVYREGGEMYVHRLTQGMWAPHVAYGDYCTIGQIG